MRSAAFLTLILDAGKGGLAVLLARWALAEDAAQLAGVAAFLGHLFPVWLGFKGGKGVATFLGTLLALSFPVGIVACGLWLLTAAATRISSLSALVAAVLSPLAAWGMDRPDLLVLTAALALIILERHRANIGRILAGQEPRIGKK